MTISALIHKFIFGDPHMSLCARAWWKRDQRFWGLFVRIVGKQHCKKSWDWYFND